MSGVDESSVEWPALLDVSNREAYRSCGLIKLLGKVRFLIMTDCRAGEWLYQEPNYSVTEGFLVGLTKCCGSVLTTLDPEERPRHKNVADAIEASAGVFCGECGQRLPDNLSHSSWFKDSKDAERKFNIFLQAWCEYYLPNPFEASLAASSFNYHELELSRQDLPIHSIAQINKSVRIHNHVKLSEQQVEPHRTFREKWYPESLE